MMNLQDKRDGAFYNEYGYWYTFKYMTGEDGLELHPDDREEVNIKIDMSDGTFRYGLLLKTRVYVATDVDEWGFLVFERWIINKIEHYKN